MRARVCLYADTSHTLPPFPSPDLGPHPLPERISMADIKKLQTLYRDHCEVRPVRAQLSTSAPWKTCKTPFECREQRDFSVDICNCNEESGLLWFSRGEGKAYNADDGFG